MGQALALIVIGCQPSLALAQQPALQTREVARDSARAIRQAATELFDRVRSRVGSDELTPGIRDTLDLVRSGYERAIPFYLTAGDYSGAADMHANLGRYHALLAAADASEAHQDSAIHRAERAVHIGRQGADDTSLGHAYWLLGLLRWQALSHPLSEITKRSDGWLGNVPLEMLQRIAVGSPALLTQLDSAWILLRQAGDECERQAFETLGHIAGLHKLTSGAIADKVGEIRTSEVSLIPDLPSTLRGLITALMPEWKRAEALYARVEDHWHRAEMLNVLAKVYASVGNLDSVIVYASRTSASARMGSHWREQARAFEHLAHASWIRDDPRTEIVHLDSARAAWRREGDRAKEAGKLRNVADAYRRLGEVGSAVEKLEQALSLYRETGDRPSEALALADLGELYLNMDLLEDAASNTTKAIAVARSLPESPGRRLLLQAFETRECAIAWARATAVTDPLRRRSALSDAREACPDSPGLDSADPGNPGADTRILDRADSALARLEGGDIGLAGILDLAELRRDEWRTVLDSALRRREADPRPARVVSILMEIGRSYSNLGEPARALVYYDSALHRAVELEDRAQQVLALYELGQVHHRAVSPARLDQAIDSYEQAVNISAELVSDAGRDRLKVAAGEHGSDLYAEWVAALLSRGDGGEADSGAEGLAAAEYSRAQALLDLMKGGATPADAPGRPRTTTDEPNLESLLGPETTILSYSLLGDTLAIWVVPPDGEPHVVRQPLLSFLHIAARSELVQTIGPSVEADLARLRGNRSDSVDAARAAEEIDRFPSPAHREATAAQFRIFWGMVFSGDPLGYRSTSLQSTQVITRQLFSELRGAVGIADVRSRLGADIERSEAIRRARPEDFPLVARDLSELLLPPEVLDLLPDRGELIIVPQGQVAQVPFAALPFGDSIDEARLGDRFSIRFAPSLRVLAEAERRPPVGVGRLSGSLVLGNPDMPTVRGEDGGDLILSRLPGAELEARQVARLLRAEALTGPSASEIDVWDRLRRAPVVHLATHGIAYAEEDRARESFIALAPSAAGDETEGESHADGRLTVGELLDSTGDLSAELVVLSACQTGLGDVTQSEGTIGLQRAFLAKGARSVLVTLWNVSDEATAELMERFYRYWLEDGYDKASALQRAQADLRTNPRWEHPRYWAAFQLVGAG